MIICKDLTAGNFGLNKGIRWVAKPLVTWLLLHIQGETCRVTLEIKRQSNDKSKSSKAQEHTLDRTARRLNLTFSSLYSLILAALAATQNLIKRLLLFL